MLVSRQRDANGLKRLVANSRAWRRASPSIISRCTGPGAATSRSTMRTPSGQAHHRQAGPAVVAAEALSSLRALDRRAGRCARHRQRARPCTRTNRSISRWAPRIVPCKIMLELIEVQTGSYLGEDDIIRIEDDYAAREVEFAGRYLVIPFAGRQSRRQRIKEAKKVF